MGGAGLAELVLIDVVLLVIGNGLAAPIVGIVRAVGRKQRGTRSTGAVVWSSINVGLFGLGTVAAFATHTPPFGPPVFCAVNGVWLYLALQANRAATPRPPEVP